MKLYYIQHGESEPVILANNAEQAKEWGIQNGWEGGVYEMEVELPIGLHELLDNY